MKKKTTADLKRFHLQLELVGSVMKIKKEDGSVIVDGIVDYQLFCEKKYSHIKLQPLLSTMENGELSRL